MAENKILLRGTNIQKEYGFRQILNIERLEIADGDRIGLVGRNGCGKSTLLKILMGELKAEQGAIVRNCGIACIAQTGETDGEADGRFISQMQIRDSAVKAGESVRDLRLRRHFPGMNRCCLRTNLPQIWMLPG